MAARAPFISIISYIVNVHCYHTVFISVLVIKNTAFKILNNTIGCYNPVAHVFYQQILMIFQQNPNASENFVKLCALFQKLDHLTCSKLEL